MGMGTSGGSCTPGQVLFCDELAWFLYLNLGRFAFSVSLTFDDRQVPSEKDCDLSIVKRGKRVGLAPRRILHVRPVRKLGSGVFPKCPDSLLDKIERSDRALLLERSGHANRESPLIDVIDILTDLKDGDSLLCRKQEIYFRSLRWVPAAGRRFSCEKVDSLELCSLERAPHRL